MWSQLLQTFFKGKGKLSLLIGPVPSGDNPMFITWDEDDSMIMPWLWNSMQLEISGMCMLLTTARDI